MIRIYGLHEETPASTKTTFDSTPSVIVLHNLSSYFPGPAALSQYVEL
jgi:hypothetical protein